MLNRDYTFKTIYSNTYTKCRQTTNKAYKYRNRFKLRRPVPEGRKVFLENHSKGLLKSKKLQELRSGFYTVQRMLTNTNYLAIINSVLYTHLYKTKISKNLRSVLLETVFVTNRNL